MNAYIVQPGDYPALLAEKYGPGPKAWKELVRLNPGITKNFYQGMVVLFPKGWKKPKPSIYSTTIKRRLKPVHCPFCHTSSPRDELNRCGWCGAPEGELP